MQILWTHEAFQQLTAIEDYISKDSPERAADFINIMVERAEAIPDSPRMGRVVPEIVNPDIRVLIFKKYRIVYRLTEQRIEILTLFEGHRLLRLDEIDV
ncbi:MAG: type II toxin-antitoxin system RelE/ParE family toxin [Bacteroidia bacterium]|nr:type II toxin-antitoxin system RelE/ParE family toxin [Bacteroidia bacterium]